MTRRNDSSKDPQGGQRGARARRALAGIGPSAANSRLRDGVVALDAEDIALARLQAHLRRTEAIHTAARPAASAPRRTTVRLPAALLARLRERAKRDGATASDIVEQALEHFLRSR